MQIDFATRELTIKLVYYGPALSGKTTNLQALHRMADPATRGRLMTLETRDDRTLFFDMLPLSFREAGDLSVRIKLFTVPGQVIHTSTRRLVLQGADGVAFIADSQIVETHANAAAFLDLRENLNANGMKLTQMPVVIQFNKRDLPDIRTDEELTDLARRGREPVFRAVATAGTGVLETLSGLLYLTLGALDAEHHLSKKFKLDAHTVLAQISSKLGSSAPVSDLLGACLGGALDVLTPDDPGKSPTGGDPGKSPTGDSEAS